MRAHVAAFALALPLVCSCAALRPMTASSDDLADYRKTRLASTVPDQLAASQEYLARHPAGAWAEEVRASFDQEELAYFLFAQSSRARAVEYLSYLPRGPHADAAFATLRAFDGHIAEDETSLLGASARRTTAELDLRANERKALLDELLEAIAVIVRAPIDGPLEEGGDLRSVVAGNRHLTWGDGLVRKERSLFVLPTATGVVDRELELSLEIVLLGGVVVSAELRGVGLFLRIGELSATRVFGDSDRPTANAYVADVVRGAMRGRFDDARCEAPVASAILRRECDGVALVVNAGEGDDPDRIRIAKSR
ncbi:hypothetical protein BH09MYX1_BH09MYX1_26460 [soil metagenome]